MRQLPGIKTQNEVGVMTWVRKNTMIPLPRVIKFDATENNPLGHEFTLLEKAPGISVDKIYNTLSAAAKRSFVEQLTGYLIQLHSKDWKDGFVGGLVIKDGVLVGGPAIDETFWQVPDLKKYWAENETLESLNPLNGPSDSYTSYNAACLDRYVYAIERHPSLEEYRDLVPRIKAFIQVITSPKHISELKLNEVRYILAHKDLHFTNIMCDPPSDPQGRCSITSVLDREFSGVVPASRWNPPRAFLWNMESTPEAKEEQTRMEELFEEICKEKGAGHLLEESMQAVVNYIWAIVEDCPRGQAGDRVRRWREVAENAMGTFGV